MHRKKNAGCELVEPPGNNTRDSCGRAFEIDGVAKQGFAVISGALFDINNSYCVLTAPIE
jgi:hypothetical protein